MANALISGIDYPPPTWRRVVAVLGLRGPALYRYLIIPGALSIGVRSQGARELNDAPLLLSYIVVVLVIGILVDVVFSVVDNALRRRWGMSMSE